MEIERKFLVLNAELITHLTKWGYAEDISQYYIQVGEFEERYRRKGDKCFHTIKKKVDDMQREEIEVEVSNECFEFNKRNRLEDSIILQKKTPCIAYKLCKGRMYRGTTLFPITGTYLMRNEHESSCGRVCDEYKQRYNYE